MKRITAVSLIVVAVICGCHASKITSSWKAPDTTPKAYNQVAVVGLIRESDRSLREQMEDHLVGDLQAQGYHAFSSYDQFGPKAFEGKREEQVYQQLKQGGADAVLTIVLLNKEKEKYYVSAAVNLSPYPMYYHRFEGYYGALITRISAGNYYDVATKYFWESNLYDLTTKELLYSVQTQTFDPSSTESLAHEYGRMIVQDLVKKNVLTSAAPAASRPM